MNTSRGEVVLVLYPNSNLIAAKRRPALVVQAANLNTGLSQTIVAMITSNMSRGESPVPGYYPPEHFNRSPKWSEHGFGRHA